jgi:hypothetical protein
MVSASKETLAAVALWPHDVAGVTPTTGARASTSSSPSASCTPTSRRPASVLLRVAIDLIEKRPPRVNPLPARRSAPPPRIDPLSACNNSPTTRRSNSIHRRRPRPHLDLPHRPRFGLLQVASICLAFNPTLQVVVRPSDYRTPSGPPAPAPVQAGPLVHSARPAASARRQARLLQRRPIYYRTDLSCSRCRPICSRAPSDFRHGDPATHQP